MPFLRNKALMSRLLPFAAFMAFIAVDEGARLVARHAGIIPAPAFLYYLYPAKTVIALAFLLGFRSFYTELRWSELTNGLQSFGSVVIGLLTFVLWVNMAWIPAGAPQPPGFNPALFADSTLRLAMILFRIAGAVLVVPLMEELFWRSLLLRYLVDQDFESVPVGRFTFFSFVATAILFGLEHHFILAGIAAGAIYSIILYRTKSIAQCVLAHAATNLALALYVLNTGKWYFW